VHGWGGWVGRAKFCAKRERPTRLITFLEKKQRGDCERRVPRTKAVNNIEGKKDREQGESVNKLHGRM